jgi:hypothetical protein
MHQFLSVFVGVPQSRYAALAVLIALVAVSLTVVLSKDTVPLSQKFGLALMVFLVSLPSLAMSLFQLTCLVTGAGAKNQRWWCWGYAWILSALIIFYSVLLIIAAIMSLSSSKEGFEGSEGSDEEKVAGKKEVESEQKTKALVPEVPMEDESVPVEQFR